MPLMLGLAITMNVGAYFFSDRLVLRMSGARELEPGELPELAMMVRELAARDEIPMPRLERLAGTRAAA